MYEYIICNQADEEIFHKQCAALEKRLKSIEKMPVLQDVDGSLIQRYSFDGKTIIVFNDLALGAVTIESEEDLEPYFS
ncbi:MAG: hypothetical protein VB035_00740 [Candidatus Fimivivens sp.]|nr:hypothetical protein [Candidatus Fimivivens sp.]